MIANPCASNDDKVFLQVLFSLCYLSIFFYQYELRYPKMTNVQGKHSVMGMYSPTHPHRQDVTQGEFF